MFRFQLFSIAALLLTPGDASLLNNTTPSVRQRRDAQRDQRTMERIALREAQAANQNCCMNVGNCLVSGCVLVGQPIEACVNCTAGAATVCASGTAQCCTASCGMASACCGEIASCCGGCWMLMPTCEQCISGAQSCVECGCGAAVWVANSVDENCIRPCCVEALYRGCMRPFIRGEWVEPCGQCCAATARCVGNCASECAAGCEEGCMACGRGCVACASATGPCLASTAADCASATGPCLVSTGQCLASTTADCASGCATCCGDCVSCLGRFPWGMRCLTVPELQMIGHCLGDAGMACMLGTRSCATATGQCIRDDLCCYPEWPTLEQVRAGCADCATGCVRCAGDCASGCVTCAGECATCATQECGRCVCESRRCIGECVSGIPECCRDCRECCGECMQGCVTCCGDCAEGCGRCCGELQVQGAACISATAERGRACVHRAACISIPSRFDAAQARMGAFFNVSAPMRLESANRGIQRATTSAGIKTHRLGLRATAPHDWQVGRARAHAEANPENDAAQRALANIVEERDDLVTERELKREAKGVRRGTTHVEGIESRPQLKARFRENKKLRYLQDYYRYMDDHMQKWAEHYPSYQSRLEAKQEAGTVLREPTMADDEFERARALLHTPGAQFKHYLAISRELMNRRGQQAQAEQHQAPGWMDGAERVERINDAPRPAGATEVCSTYAQALNELNYAADEDTRHLVHHI